MDKTDKTVSIPRLLIAYGLMGGGMLWILLADLYRPQTADGLRDWYSEHLLQGETVSREDALRYGMILQAKTQGLYQGSLLPAGLILVGGVLNGQRYTRKQPEPGDRGEPPQ